MGFPKQHVRVSSVWKHCNKASVKISGTWKVIARAWQKISGVWTNVANYSTVPAGAIVLFSGTVIPTGWTRLTTADGRFIVGAGSTYSYDATGGVDTNTFSGSTNNTGAHTGAVYNYATYSYLGNYQGYPRYYNLSYGGHTHTYSTTPNVKDVYKDFILIKADAETLLPQDAIVLAAASLNLFTNVETSVNRYVQGASTYGGTGGASGNTSAVTTSSQGSHGHGRASSGTDGSYSGTGYIFAGSHNHSLTVSWTLGTYGLGLSAWKAAADATAIEENAIFMWQGVTAPYGYHLCDGANGTPDMRNRFLKIVDIASHGTGYGNSSNNTSWSTSTDSKGNHTHTSGTHSGQSGGATNTGHNTTQNNHTHSTSGSTAIVQKYLALTFIMKAA